MKTAGTLHSQSQSQNANLFAWCTKGVFNSDAYNSLCHISGTDPHLFALWENF